MAKAVATCMCETCGKPFTVSTIKRNTTEAADWEKWAAKYYNECVDCRRKRIAKENDAENAEALELSKERGYPELKGTEKQIAWANTLRLHYLDRLRDQVEGSTLKDKEWVIRQYEEICSFILRTYRQASFWIDNREYVALDRRVRRDMLALETDKSAVENTQAGEASQQKTSVNDVVTAPETQKYDGVVEIQVAPDKVSATYAKNDAFREAVKALNFSWGNGCWYKNISAITGTAADRAAELGNKLLGLGFAIHIEDPEIRAAAVEGRYEPQSYRWISCRNEGEYKGWLVFHWERAADLYQEARSIPHSRYDRPNVVVPAKEYSAVEKFAEKNGFRYTEGASEAIAQAKQNVEVV